MNLITSALSRGFSSKQVIDFLLRKFPEHADKIKGALTAGFGAEQILKFLGGGRKSVNEPAKSPDTTEHAQTRSTDIQRRENVNKGFVKGSVALAAPIAMQVGLPLAQQALQRALPKSLESMIPALTSQLPQQTQQQQSSQVPPVTPNLTQSVPVAQPEQIPINASEILSNSLSKQKVDDLIKSGNTPEGISAFFQNFHPKIISEVEKKSGKSFPEVINEYISQNPVLENEQAEQQKTQVVKNLEQSGKKLDETEEAERPEIAKNDTVATSHGLGEVKEIRGDQALVEIDGKLKKVPVEELIESPIPKADLADLYDNLISGIEKSTGRQVSRHVDWAGYDPRANELAYKPHGSDRLYAYDEISPEDSQELTSLLTLRKSTGENLIGAWEAGTTSPIGAAMHKLIMKLQKERGGKGNEYKNRYDTIYDAIEPAKKAAKKRYAERNKKAKESGIG